MWANTVSCGILYQVDHKFLAIHPTMADHWSIPKGVKENNETVFQAVVRELQEETGIIIPEKEYPKVTDIGRFKYIKGKDIHLFYYDGNKTFQSMDILTCQLLVGEQYPEVDKYKFVWYDELIKMVNYKLSEVLTQIEP